MIPLTIALAVLGLIFVVGIFLVELERFGWATLTLIATVVTVQLTHVADILHYVSGHVVETLLYVLGYLVVGVVWSFIKWFSFLMKFRDKFRTLKQQFLDKQGITGSVVPEASQEAFKEFMRTQYQYGDYRGVTLTQKPRAVDNKSRITAWMAFWPCSVIGTVLNDPVKRLFKFLFNTFKALYQKMADRVFANDPELK